MLLVYSIVGGFIIMLITSAIEAQLPSEEDIGLKIWDQYAKMDFCETEQCVKAHKDIITNLNNALELREKQNSVFWTGKIVGGFLVALPILSVVSSKR